MKNLIVLLVVLTLGCSSSELVEYYDNGQIKSVFTLKDRKREGVSIHYYPNGKVKYETYYSNDQKNGVARFYDTLGNLRGIQNWSNVH